MIYTIYMIMVWELIIKYASAYFLNYFLFYDMGSNGDMFLSSPQFWFREKSAFYLTIKHVLI